MLIWPNRFIPAPRPFAVLVAQGALEGNRKAESDTCKFDGEAGAAENIAIRQGSEGMLDFKEAGKFGVEGMNACPTCWTGREVSEGGVIKTDSLSARWRIASRVERTELMPSSPSFIAGLTSLIAPEKKMCRRCSPKGRGKNPYGEESV